MSSESNHIISHDHEFDPYKARLPIESALANLKLFQAIATCYDKTARNSPAGIHLAAAVIWFSR